MKNSWIVLLGVFLILASTVFALCGPQQYSGYLDENQTWQNANVDVWDCPEYGVHYVVISNSSRLIDNGTWIYQRTVEDNDQFEQNGKPKRIFIVDPEGNCWIVVL